VSWWGRPRVVSEPWHGYYVVCERYDGLDYFGGSLYTRKSAQALADEWTARFDRYYWVESQAEYDVYLAKRKTQVLEREVGIK